MYVEHLSFVRLLIIIDVIKIHPILSPSIRILRRRLMPTVNTSVHNSSWIPLFSYLTYVHTYRYKHADRINALRHRIYLYLHDIILKLKFVIM